MRQEELPLDDPRLDPPETIVVRSYVRTRPAARKTDPAESHEAAARVANGNGELCKAIREAVWQYGPLMAWPIAHAVDAQHPGRWQLDTIRTAIKRAGLVKLGTNRALDTGRAYGVYGMPDQTWP